MSDEEDFDCPLCMEELDISDRNFRPCPCGYQICRFCWHHIKENLNGRCPACRRAYSEETVEFIPISADELAMMKHEKKQREREKKESEAMNRKHLANMRVVQKSLVYVIGLPAKLACDEHTLRQHEYFGQYGKIAKVVIHRRNTSTYTNGSSPGLVSVGVYITYVRKEDAAKAIAAIDGSNWDGKTLRASYGTTKYCTNYLRSMSCQNPGCMYLHEPGEDADSFTKEDLAVGKHHLTQDYSSPDTHGQKSTAPGRLPLPHHGPGSLTPKPKPATVATMPHPNAVSLSDWPTPGGDRSNHDDRDEESSALPATASWGKISSNPSTPTLHNSTLRKPDGPPPLRSKGSAASIITGEMVVNNGKRKELNQIKDGSQADNAPTPAESLTIGAAAKQQMQIEQRQQQEQSRKHQHLQKQQQQEAERQAELLNQELWKQKQKDMEQRMQKQKEKEEWKKEQERQERLQKEKEQHERDRKEQELKEHKEREMREEREERERAEKERLEKAQLEGERLERERIKKELEKQREEKEREEKEQREKDEQEQEKRRRRQEEREREQEREREEKEARLAYHQPILSLGSFSFNPDASLTTLPPVGGDDRHVLGSETAGPFGLDTFAAFSTLSLAPTHYTGSFNPFSMDDMPLMRRSLVPSGSFFKDNDISLLGRNRPVVPPIPGKPRQTSRFGFAVDNQHSESLGRDDSDPTRNILSVQDGLGTPFPSTNMSFQQIRSPSNQHSQHPPLQRQQLHQARFQTSPSTPRQGADTNMGMWDSGEKRDGLAYTRNVNQLNPDTMTPPTSLLAEYHQQLSIQQPQLQRCGPPGLVRHPAIPTAIKSPPPGLEDFSRSNNSLSMSQQNPQEQQSQMLQQRRQQHQQSQPLQQMYQHQTSRPDNWTSDSTMDVHGTGSRGSSAHDFFGAFLKAAASQASQSNPTEDTSGVPASLAFQDPAIMSARISSSKPSRNPLANSLQQPTPGDYSNSFGLLSHDPLSGAESHVNNSALLQRFGLGPGRMDPYSQTKPNNMGAYPSVFGGGGGESPLMNTINSAADARSAKVKSDLLMGLNAGIRPDQQSIKDPHPHQQQQPALSLSEEHASILGNLNSGLQTSAPAVNNQFGDANNGSGYSAVTGDYPSHPSSHHEGFNVNGLYGTNLMISLPMSSVGTGGTMSTAGPPPGLSPHPGNDFNSSSVSAGSADNGGSGMAPSFLGGNLNSINLINPINPSSGTHSNIVRPLDIASMMNTLDFFGPSPASPVPSSVINVNSWSLPPYGAGLGEGHIYHQETANGSSQDGSEIGSALSHDSSTAQSKPNQGNVSSPGTPGSASTRSVEDLELQVINAKMETQMLENQLNAVIKRNRRKLYA